MKAAACLYIKLGNKTPVRSFVDSLDIRSQRKFFFVKDLLEEFGRKLPYPHSKYIGDDIYELRFNGVEGTVRILYFFDCNNAILTTGFIKKSNRTPKREKELAIKRRRMFFQNT